MRTSITSAMVEQIKAIGATNIKQTRVGGIIFADLTEKQIAQLKSEGALVEPVHKVKSSGDHAAVYPPLPIGPVEGEPIYTPEALIIASGFEEMRQATTPPTSGEGMTLAIIGTGIRDTHQKISGRVVYSKNFTADPMRDGFDHDTGVCSIALAVAPQCNILNFKVLDDSGEGTDEQVVMAIDECIALFDDESVHAPQVINLSLGTIDDGNPNSPLRVICREAAERNIWCAAAAGNGGPEPGTITSPACDPIVFATGSCKIEPLTVSEFSSRGPTIEGVTKPDAVFFGENIEMASSEGDAALVVKSGTSFSVAFTSGIAILYRESEVKATAWVPIQGLAPSGVKLPIITMPVLIGKWLHGFCVKPQHAPLSKDNSYGEGIPFGPLLTQLMEPSLDANTLIAPMIMLMMMSMIMKAMKG